MPEKRKYRRLPIKLTLEVSNLFCQQGNLQIESIEFNVFNISRAGLGFTTTAVIPLDYYFNATIEFEGTDDCLKYVVKIIRTKEIENGMHEYGCEFVGFASIYDSIFDKYEKKFANYEE